MTEKEITKVFDISDPDARGNRYINVIFTDGDTAYIGKKDLDDALYVQALLIEAQNKPQDFTLEDTGKKNAKGGTRFKIKAFGEYQPTPFQGGGSSAASSTGYSGARSRSPESTEDDIRRAVAIKAAATFRQGWPLEDLEQAYHFIDELLQGVRVAQANSNGSPRADQHGLQEVPMQGDAERGRAGGEGEAHPACPPHDPDMNVGEKFHPCRKCGVPVRKGGDK